MTNFHQNFEQQNPLSFALVNYYNPDDRNILFINDDPRNLKFRLEIKNQSSQAIHLKPRIIEGDDPSTPNENVFHIEMKFMLGELSDRSMKDIDLTEPAKEEWSMSRPKENPDHTVSIYLLKRVKELTIESQGENKSLSFVGISASSLQGARASNLEIKYQNFYFGDNPNDYIDQAQKLITLTVLNFSGQRRAELAITCACAPTVLINSEKTQTITLQIVNTGVEPIALNEKSKFIITIDSTKTMKQPYALAKTDEAINVKPRMDKGEAWIIKPTEGENPSWTITPKSVMRQIKPNEDIFIYLDNFNTTLPAGVGNIYFGYYNLPGYTDKKECISLYKTCITEQSGGRIGINKYPDSKAHLDVKGKVVSDDIMVKSELEVKGKVKGNIKVEGTLELKNVKTETLTAESLDVKNNINTKSLGAIEKITAESLDVKNIITATAVNSKNISAETLSIERGFIIDYKYYGSLELDLKQKPNNAYFDNDQNKCCKLTGTKVGDLVEVTLNASLTGACYFSIHEPNNMAKELIRGAGVVNINEWNQISCTGLFKVTSTKVSLCFTPCFYKNDFDDGKIKLYNLSIIAKVLINKSIS